MEMITISHTGTDTVDNSECNNQINADVHACQAAGIKFFKRNAEIRVPITVTIIPVLYGCLSDNQWLL